MKRGFIMYHEHKEVIERLTDEEAGKILKALYAYSTGGEITTFEDRFLDLAFGVFRAMIDRDAQAYEDKCERNKAAAKKRWDADGCERIQTNADGCERMRTMPIQPQHNTTTTTKQPQPQKHIERAFDEWLAVACPYIYQHYTKPTDGELAKLFGTYGEQAVRDMCQQIENRVDLRRRYSNLYRTVLNWLKRETKDNGKNERISGYAAVAAEYLQTNS